MTGWRKVPRYGLQVPPSVAFAGKRPGGQYVPDPQNKRKGRRKERATGVDCSGGWWRKGLTDSTLRSTSGPYLAGGVPLRRKVRQLAVQQQRANIAILCICSVFCLSVCLLPLSLVFPCDAASRVGRGFVASETASAAQRPTPGFQGFRAVAALLCLPA